MRRPAVLLVMALAGCADAIRFSVTAGRAVCGALGCPCAPGASGGARSPVGFEARRDGTVRAIYAEDGR